MIDYGSSHGDRTLHAEIIDIPERVGSEEPRDLTTLPTSSDHYGNRETHQMYSFSDEKYPRTHPPLMAGATMQYLQAKIKVNTANEASRHIQLTIGQDRCTVTCDKIAIHVDLEKQDCPLAGSGVSGYVKNWC